jgi:hypothetical protein
VNWAPDGRELRKFALAMIVGFGIIGAIVAVRHGAIDSSPRALWAVGAGLAAGAVIPGLGRYVFLAVYLVTGVIGFVISRVLMTVMFFALFTPIALILRLTGKDLLHLRRNPGSTEWIAHGAAADRRRYYRQF